MGLQTPVEIIVVYIIFNEIVFRTVCLNTKQHGSIMENQYSKGIVKQVCEYSLSFPKHISKKNCHLKSWKSFTVRIANSRPWANIKTASLLQRNFKRTLRCIVMLFAMGLITKSLFKFTSSPFNNWHTILNKPGRGCHPRLCAILVVIIVVHCSNVEYRIMK